MQASHAFKYISSLSFSWRCCCIIYDHLKFNFTRKEKERARASDFWCCCSTALELVVRVEASEHMIYANRDVIPRFFSFLHSNLRVFVAKFWRANAHK